MHLQNETRELLSLLFPLFLMICLAVYLVPKAAVKPKIPRNVVIAGFIPTIDFIIVGCLFFDDWYASRSMFALALSALFLGPLLSILLYGLTHRSKC